MKLPFFCVAVLTLSALMGCTQQPTPNTDEPQTPAANNETDEAAQRSFRFHYDVAVSDLTPGAKARVWLPIAQDGPHQKITKTEIKLPAEYEESTDAKYGNKVISFEAVADENGEIPVHIVYEITRDEVVPANAAKATEEKANLFLAASSLVPVDGSLSARVLGEKELDGSSLEVSRQLYDAVEAHMSYGKPDDKAWGRGDANFACDEGVGNCTDFHSLFISLSRDRKIPAKFEMGFPIPDDADSGSVGGYHCWALFSDGDRWLPVDISEADKHPEMKEYYFTRLTPHRVTFTQGRDLELSPAPAAGAVNYLVYPYAEVDGAPHASIRKNFRYENLP